MVWSPNGATLVRSRVAPLGLRRRGDRVSRGFAALHPWLLPVAPSGLLRDYFFSRLRVKSMTVVFSFASNAVGRAFASESQQTISLPSFTW